jgi:hypothetical protein
LYDYSNLKIAGSIPVIGAFIESIKMNRSYLVFLDVDGVFTSSRVHTAHNAHEAAMWQRFDPVAVDFMNYVHDTYAVQFVLMSTWKNGLRNDDPMTEHWVRAAFANSGFRGDFASPWKTDPDNFAAMKKWDRGDEVKNYLETFATDVKDFILFDDNQYNFERVLGKKRLVRTDPENGLLHKHMLNAKSMMGTWTKK